MSTATPDDKPDASLSSLPPSIPAAKPSRVRAAGSPTRPETATPVNSSQAGSELSKPAKIQTDAQPTKARRTQTKQQYTSLTPIQYQVPTSVMNHPFSGNGSAFVRTGHPSQPVQSHHPSPNPVAGQPHNGQAHPQALPHTHFAYQPMQHYQAHPYPNYPNYPHHMVAYTTPPPPPAAPPVSAPPAAGNSSSSSVPPGPKRKRKSTTDSGKGRPPSDNEDSTSDMHKKRTKTQRACDSCRTRKIRCDVLTDAEPPLCQHCKQYGFECTFFLPITETRFKKKRLEEEAAAAVVPIDKDRTVSDSDAALNSPIPDQPKGEVKVYGPTSMAHLLHSTALVPSRAYQSYDLRYHHSWEISKTGDGVIQLLEPTRDEALSPSLSSDVEMRLERDVIEKLINCYFRDIAPLLPVITQAEFLADPSPSPLLLYSICLVAAAQRNVPIAVFDSLRATVNSILKSEDVLSTASIVNVQSLLILCQSGDAHSQFVPNALSALWLRLGTAIRMAQDLGLHRAEAVKQNIEMRRRLWGACVITDRWTSLAYGHPYMIDVEDCDARLPSSGDPNDRYNDELVRLSLILGRVLKTIYTPSGLTTATDDKLYELLNDMQAWRERLPEHLRFHGRQTQRQGGLLHLLYSCVSMMFWRVFMRISYSCPIHLKFALTIDQWTELVGMSGEAIDWLDGNEHLYDMWMLVAYAATSCALVQYHTWARRKDADAQAKLRTLRDCVRRWEASLQPDHMSARRKTAEIITLLYEATQGPPVSVDEPPLLNPTAGVRNKIPASFKGLVYKKDPSRPGGGVFIARGRAKGGDYTNIAEGTVIINTGTSDEEGSETGASTSLNASLAQEATASIVNFAPLGTSFSNVNPSLNEGMVTASDVQVLNVLDMPMPQAPNALEQFAVADSGLLEGIPGSMFDWPQWETFFSRFNAQEQNVMGHFPPHPNNIPVVGPQPTPQEPETQQNLHYQT